MDREAIFLRIKEAYDNMEQRYLRVGQLPMRSTEKGFWGVSNCQDVYDWFVKMDFPKETKFCDLGMGDGRVVLIASLFVHATGVEIDDELVNIAKEIADEVGIGGVTFIRQDFADTDLNEFDVLYSYADTNWEVYREQLEEELRGTLYLYHDTYRPYFLKKGKTTWIGQIPIYCYTKA